MSILKVVSEIPNKKATRVGKWNIVIGEFIESNNDICQIDLKEAGCKNTKCYNGIIMAIRRKYDGKVKVLMRNGEIYLVRVKEGCSDE